MGSAQLICQVYTRTMNTKCALNMIVYEDNWVYTQYDSVSRALRVQKEFLSTTWRKLQNKLYSRMSDAQQKC